MPTAIGRIPVIALSKCYQSAPEKHRLDLSWAAPTEHQVDKVGECIKQPVGYLLAAYQIFHGSHGLSCRRGAGRLPRHDAINDIIHRALIKAQVPSQKEPKGLTRDGTDKRVDGCTLIPLAIIIIVIIMIIIFFLYNNNNNELNARFVFK